MKTKLIKKTIATILSFILCLLITFLIALFALTLTLFRPDNMRDYLNKSDYYEKTVSSIREDFHSIAIPGGIEKTLFDKIISTKDVGKEIEEHIYYSFTNKDFIPDTAGLQKKLNATLVEYATKNNITITDEIRTNLNEMVKLCLDAYSSQIKSPMITIIGKFSYYFRKLFLPCIFVILMLMGCIIFALYKLFARSQTATRFLVYSLHSASLIILVPTIYSFASGFYERIQFYPQQQYEFFKATAFSVLISLLIIALISAFIGGLLIFLSTKKRHHSH